MAAMAEARERRYLSRGQVMRVASEAAKRRLVYIEKKDGDIDGAAARIGWVAFLDGGLRAHYRGRTLTRAAEGSQGNYFDEGSGDEYWISRIKKTGSHAHFAPRVAVRIDPDARYEYRRVRSSAGVQVRR